MDDLVVEGADALLVEADGVVAESDGVHRLREDLQVVRLVGGDGVQRSQDAQHLAEAADGRFGRMAAHGHGNLCEDVLQVDVSAGVYAVVNVAQHILPDLGQADGNGMAVG